MTPKRIERSSRGSKPRILSVERQGHLEQVRGIEPPSQPWQGRALTVVLYLHGGGQVIYTFMGLPQTQLSGGYGERYRLISSLQVR